MNYKKWLAAGMLVGSLAGAYQGCKTEGSLAVPEPKVISKNAIYDIGNVYAKADSITLPLSAEYISSKRIDSLIDSLYSEVNMPKVLDRDFFRAAIMKESSYNRNAYNEDSGARGLGQILKRTWDEIDSSRDYHEFAFDEKASLENSMKTFKNINRMLGVLHPNWNDLSEREKREQIIASYNWGIGNLRDSAKWDFSKVPEETSDYAAFVEEKMRE